MSQYVPKHFKIYELVNKSTYAKYGEKAWWFLDDRLLKIIDTIREDLGPMTVNSWYWGGPFQWRGLRTSEYYQGKPSQSQHSFGRAVDFDVKGMTADEVRLHIRNNPEYGITAIENDVNWVHIDIRNVDPLMEFNP